MKLQEFEYHLPRNRIAQYPQAQRDQSRLMVLDRKKKTWEHRIFADLPQYLQSGDALVVNETKVLPARLWGKKISGGLIEILLVRKSERINDEEGKPPKRKLDTPRRQEEWTREWECLVKNSARIRENTPVIFDDELQGQFLKKLPSGLWRLGLKGQGDIDRKIWTVGFPPLPPYIRRNGDWQIRARDLERYQTVYAREEGAIAAPTAGMHFTEALLDKIRKQGVRIAPLTLHVGLGTFLPVKQEEVEKHHLTAEYFELPEETTKTIHKARSNGKRIIAVGTTVTRALESCVEEKGEIQARRGETSLFILPGFPFRAVDGLITNFHLPRSTLLMLVYAFAGKEFIRAAYDEAIRENYRFYSYGDAMLIL